MLSAASKLAARLHPVTAETLRACGKDAQRAIRQYRNIVYILVLVIIPISMLTFISNGISNAIKTEIATANDLVVTLHTKLSSAKPDEATNALLDLQQFAAAGRAARSRANQLNLMLLNSTRADDIKSDFEIRQGLFDKFDDVKAEVDRLTGEYQKIRSFANTVVDAASVWWGAVTATILPVLYALLGAGAAVLRAFTQHLDTKTFSPSYATPARFIIAAIAGVIIGLFGNLQIGEGLSPSPLAVAFLVGYAADIFFSLLEGSIPATKLAERPAGAPGT